MVAARRRGSALAGASVRGRCTLQSGSVRDLDAPSVSGFVAAALARECKYAYLWWPTYGPQVMSETTTLRVSAYVGREAD